MLTLVRTAGIEPAITKEADFRTTSACAAAGLDRRSWSGLSLHRGFREENVRCRPSSLYTFPHCGLGSGLAGPVVPAFPDFERFYSGDFPPGTPIEVCCVYQFRHVREGPTLTQDATGWVT